MKKPTQLLSVQLITALLVACGGGGSETATKASEGNQSDSTKGSATASYTLSGHVIAKAWARSDSDINFLGTTTSVANQSNDTTYDAQIVNVQSVISGYLNIAGSGPNGALKSSGDPVDIYYVSLEQGQAVQLNMHDTTASIRVDFYAADNLLAPVKSVTSMAGTLATTVPTSTDYYLKLSIISGSSSYALSLGDTDTTASAQSIGGDFEPGEILVKYTDAAARSLSPSSSLGRPLGNNLYAIDVSELLETNSDIVTALAENELDTASRGLFAETGDALLKTQTLEAVALLNQRSDVLYAEPNYRVYPSAIPNDPDFDKQRHYQLINLQQAWDLETGNSDVIVAVIDTGIVTNHPDLAPKLVDGYDFISSASYSGDSDGIDNDPYDNGDPTHSIAYHGTHVAGTIAAATNNGQGIAGISWGARIMPLRALAYDSGSASDVAQAVRYAAGLDNSSGIKPAKAADIINLSLGGTSRSKTLEQAIHDARQAGVIIVAAAGNQGSSTPNYPAGFDGVISVSAVDANLAKTYYSNYGSTIDIAAPGGDSGDSDHDGYSDAIYSTRNNSSGNISYGYMKGTSMATPHVSGVLALMKSANPFLTPEQVDNMIANGAITRDLGTTGRDNEFGYGLIDAYKAVQVASSNAHGVSTSERVLHMGMTETATLTITGSTSANSSVTPSISSDWLELTPVSVNGSGFGTYEVNVNRDGLRDGAYEGSINFSLDDDTTATTTVYMTVASNDPDADLGVQTLLLYSVVTGSKVREIELEANQGIYSFTLEDIPAGTYTITVGSDQNNNDFLCNVGETCGAYPNLSAPQTITLDRDVENIDFMTSVVTEQLSANSLSSLSVRANQ